MPVNNYHQAGLTLIELMMTLVIATILLVMAAPSFVDLIKRNELRSQSNTLLSHLHFARSESVKLSDNIILCRSSNPLASPPSCMADGSDWSSGWITFQDVNGNSTYNDGTDVLLTASQNAGQNNLTVMADSNSKITFNSRGSLSSTFKMAICDDRDGNGTYEQEHGKEIRISVTGHPVILDTVTFNTNCVPQ